MSSAKTHLLQVPIDFVSPVKAIPGKKRKKRGAEFDGSNDIFAAAEADYDDDGGLASAFHLGKIATRFRNGMILYALMDSDRDCRYDGDCKVHFILFVLKKGTSLDLIISCICPKLVWQTVMC